jgi:hypothetical protein
MGLWTTRWSWCGGVNTRIPILLDSRDLEELNAPEAEITGMWSKASRTFQSSGSTGLAADPDARYTLLYQSALQGATAIVRAAGYRVRGDHNHQITFAAAAALTSGELSNAARDLNVIRQRRHAAVYDWQTTISEGDLAVLRNATSTLLRHGHR